MGLVEQKWHVYVGDTWLGTLTPTGEHEGWVGADFEPSDNWDNFSPWFAQAYDAHQNGDTGEWERIYSQIETMGLTITADSGETYDNPTLLVSEGEAWFAV
jgi:hypothetical protein